MFVDGGFIGLDKDFEVIWVGMKLVELDVCFNIVYIFFVDLE